MCLLVLLGRAGLPAQDLPGSDGPRLELGQKAPREIEVVDVFVYATAEQAAEGTPRPRRFPAKTNQLWLDVRTKALPGLGVTLRYTLRGRDGAVPLADALVTFATLAAIGGASTVFELRPMAGYFAEGPYQLQLFVDEVLVATLNWSVGG